MIDVKDLEAFLAIIDGGSISKAAEDLGVTQPALSLKLKKMESVLGVPLFQRTSRNVIPLDAARVIEGKVRDIMGRMDMLHEALAESLVDLRGQVRVGSMMGWFETIFVPTIRDLREGAPNIRLRLHVGESQELVQMVSQGQLDIAIVADPFERADGVASQFLLDEELVLVGRNLPTGSAKDRQKALLARPWVTLHYPDSLVEIFWRASFNANFPWENVSTPVVADNIVSIHAIVAAIPESVAILPAQIIDRPDWQRELQTSESIKHKNGLHLIWRAHGLELKRYQVVRDTILKQIERYKSE